MTPKRYTRSSANVGMNVLSDPVLIGILVALGTLFFLGFLLIRRTVMAFREGVED